MERKILNMDFDWRFHLGDISSDGKKGHSTDYFATKAGAMIGAGGKYFNDTEWERVDLPHDYYASADFSEESPLSHGYRKQSNGWYRKSFILDETLSDRELFLCFEGTAVTAEFYFNGSLMARSFSAYNETLIDITDRAYFGDKANTLAVYINGKTSEGWWYEGAGIYRHVRLYAKNKVHIAHNGLFGKPTLVDRSRNEWSLDIETEIENSGYESALSELRLTLLDGNRTVAENTGATVRCASNECVILKRSIPVFSPTPWDIDDPKLYTLKAELIRGGEVIDVENVRIGFRTFEADPQRGFFLNGKSIKLKGTCNHQDHAGVGVALPDSIHRYRIKLLKEMGSNAYRCAHNPPAKELLDACDELGMLVMDESRHFESTEESLYQLKTMVKRDRNHPSVVMWSLLNEEPLQDTEEGANIFRRMRAVAAKLDDSRIFTGGDSGLLTGGAENEMDAVGINYHLEQSVDMHKRLPRLTFYGSETNSVTATRGCYVSDREKHVLSNYDEEVVAWGQSSRNAWDFVRSYDHFGGYFIWTGFDYRGEPTPFCWPSVSSQFGIMDTCGFPKDAYYIHKACFENAPLVHLLPHWNWNKGDTVRVMATSNCDEVELFLNGKSLGKKKNEICRKTPEWNVKYREGVLSAKAYRDGVCVADDEIVTAGKPYAIRLSLNENSIKNDGQDAVVLNACVVDEKGIVVPDADNLLHFEVEGGGYVRGVGNGDPNSHEPDVADYRRAYNGYCQAIIGSRLGAEKISVRVWSETLESAKIALGVQAVEAPLRPSPVSFRAIEDFFMSPITEEKPNVLSDLADNDMNSYVPLRVQYRKSQTDFFHGWRIYKTEAKAYADGEYSLQFGQLRCNYAEIYVNGELVDTVNEYLKFGFDTKSFRASAETELDIRILMYVESESPRRGAGIEARVLLQEKRCEEL